MTGSPAATTAAISGSAGESAARSSSDGFNLEFFKARLDELGLITHEQRAERAGLPLRTYYRVLAGETSLRLKKVNDVARRLGVTSAQLMGGE